MRPPQACGITSVVFDGRTLTRLPLGEETRDWWMGTAPHSRCHDCGVLGGQTHHIGCDMEQCPNCYEQFLGCDCDLAEDK
jgi:hypothetical protein